VNPGQQDFLIVLAITIAAIAVATVVGPAVGIDPNRVSDRLLPDVASVLAVKDSLAQRMAFAAGLLSFLGLLALTFYWRSAFARLDAMWRCQRTVELFWAAALVASMAGWIVWQPPVGVNHVFQKIYGLVYVPGQYDVVIAIIASAIFLAFLVLAGHRGWLRLCNQALLILTLLYCTWLMAAGFMSRLRLDGLDPAAIVMSLDAHFSGLLGDRLQLTAGLPLFDLVQPDYGFLWPVLFAAIERLEGTFSLAQSVRLIQGSQVVFLLIYALALTIYARGAPLGVAVALLIVVPWIHTLHASIFHPNQAGWRYLGLAIGLLALALASNRRLERTTMWLGGVGGICVLINYETGVAVTAALVFFVCLRLDGARLTYRLALAGLWFSGGFALTQFGFWVLAGLGLGLSPAPVHLLFWPLFQERELVIFGQKLYSDPWIALIMLHAATAVGLAVLARRRRHLTGHEAVRAAVGLIILIWLNYWMTRPDPWNRWSYLVLYGPFLVDMLRPESLARYYALARQLRPAPAALALILIIGPGCILFQYQAAPMAYQAMAVLLPPDPMKARVLSGAWFDRNVADRLEGKAAGIRAAAAHGRVLFISAHSFTLTVLSNHAQPLRERDFFFTVSTPAKRDRFIAEVLAYAPDRILIDDELPPADIPVGHRHLFDAFEQAFSKAYQIDPNSAPGWRVLRRRDLPPLDRPASRN
jgi:hypothetical protein